VTEGTPPHESATADTADAPPAGAPCQLSPALPERLRLETRDLHAATERAGAMAALLAGRLPLPGYCMLLRNLHALYTALELALDARRHDLAIATLHAADLQRATALAADLHTLHGADWASALPLQPAAAVYVARLQALAAAGSPALVAHAYVRYLGDLHGGQVLQRLVRRHYALTGDAGTCFYSFGAEPAVLALRQRLREALGRLPLTAAEQDQVVAEARWAFVQHQRLFEELAGG
jgi:heme oxygenase (biliverdin-producing, ferredoxin)